MIPDHTHHPDPIVGRCPCQMNIVEWCDWEARNFDARRDEPEKETR